MPSDAVVHFRIDHEGKEALRARAKAAGMDMTAYILAAMESYASGGYDAGYKAGYDAALHERRGWGRLFALGRG